jgi:ubiquinol-cytochrome c reductase subunit 6
MTLADLLFPIFTTARAEEAEPATEELVEEEPEDTKPAIMEAALETKQCAPLKHHLDECAKRVEEGSNENCIEEFFHVMHCQDQYAAPRIFATLK